jgi:hypothetical protein
VNRTWSVPLLRPLLPVSLSTIMLKTLNVHTVLRIFDDLHGLERHYSGGDYAPEIISGDNAAAISSQLSNVLYLCDPEELRTAWLLADRLNRRVTSGQCSYGELHKTLPELRSRVEDALSTMRFVHIDRLDYSGNPELFGTSVSLRFPSAVFDIEKLVHASRMNVAPHV